MYFDACVLCVSDVRRARAPSKKKFDEEMEALCTNIRKTEEQLEALVSFEFWPCMCAYLFEFFFFFLRPGVGGHYVINMGIHMILVKQV